MDALFDLLLKNHVLGEVAAYISVFEWQKRGLPHSHTLLILKDDFKPRSPHDVDQLVKSGTSCSRYRSGIAPFSVFSNNPSSVWEHESRVTLHERWIVY